MKGIILAGGHGTRLYPLTKTISKQILPIYNKPMIYYPLSTLMLAGIKEIALISTERDLPLFQNLFGTGEHLGIHIQYLVQTHPRGLPDAFIVAEDFIGQEDCALVLGDNFFYGEGFTGKLKYAIEKLQQFGAVIFGAFVKNPESYGVLTLDEQNKIVGIEEKPQSSSSNIAITGLYFFSNNVIKKAKSLKPAKRNELEITDLIKSYHEENQLSFEILGRGYAWLDTGTFDGLLEASQFVQTIEHRQGLQIANLEEISFRNGWIHDKPATFSGEDVLQTFMLNKVA